MEDVKKSFLKDITKIVVETDEEKSKTICIINDDGTEWLADGIRIRYTPRYD